jgi:hypothetical protein
MKRKRLLIASVIALVLALVAIFFVKKVHYVDTKPAIALGEEYFSKLKSGQVGSASVMYTDEFRRKHGASWEKLLSELNTKYGAVTAFTLLDAKIVPMATPLGEVACVAVHYHVTRSAFLSEERLVVCPEQPKMQIAIAGHELIRLDSGQRIAAGISVEEHEVFSVGGTKPTIGSQTDLEAARNAADEFYRRVSAKEYGAIWDAAHDDLKHSASRDQMISAMQQLNQKLGVCSAPTLANTDYANKDGGRFVGLVYSRKCEYGEVNERLAWKIVDGKALLRGYH